MQKKGGWYASGYGYNCDVEEASDTSDDGVECFGGNAGYGVESEDFSAGFEVGYTNSLVDSDGFEGFFESSEIQPIEREGGYTIYGQVSSGNCKLLGEVVQGADDIQYAESVTDTPLAWNVEFDYSLNVFGKDAIFGVGFQSSDNLAGFLPEQRILSTFGVSLNENITTAIEYKYDQDYDLGSGGTDEDAHTVTVELALGF